MRISIVSTGYSSASSLFKVIHNTGISIMKRTTITVLSIGFCVLFSGVDIARAGIIEDLGPEMWFNANISSSVTANGSNQVTQWNDLANASRYASAAASNNVLLGYNGPYGTASIDFTSAGTMGLSSNQVAAGKTVFTLFQTNNMNIAWTNPIGGNYHLTDGDNKGYRGFVRSGGAVRIQPKISSVTDWVIQTMEYDIGDRYSLWVDGNLQGTLTSGQTAGDFGGFGQNNFNGSLSQVLVFNGALTDADRQAVEAQMVASLASTVHVGGENTIGTNTQTGVKANETYTPGVDGAKYIRVVQNVNDTFQVAELQAFETGTGTNVALAGTATAKDNYGNNSSLPGRAIDGNTSGQWGDSSVWHSNSKAGTWLEIDLGSAKDLDSVHFWGRTDCCQSRQDDFNLIVSDASNNELYNQRLTGIGTSPGRNQLIPLNSLASADLVATLASINTYAFEIGDGVSDQLSIFNPDPSIFNTVLDINGATIQVDQLGALIPGQEYQIFDVDSIIGTYGELILPSNVDGSMLLINGAVTVTPEPTTFVLAVFSLLGLVAFSRRRKR